VEGGLTAEKVVGLHPTPDQGGLLVLSSLDAPRRPNGVESPLCSLPNLLSLPKDASLHLRKLARHPCRDSRNLSIRPAATPRGWCIPQTLELLESNQGIKMKPICSFAFNKESSMPFCNFAGKDELLQSQS